MAIRYKSITVEKMDAPISGVSSGESIEHVEAERASVADLNGNYEYTLVNFLVTVDVERESPDTSDQIFKQIQYRLSIPKFGWHREDLTKVYISPGNNAGDSKIGPFFGLSLGTVNPQDAQLLIEFLDKGKLLISKSMPIIFQNAPTSVGGLGS